VVKAVVGIGEVLWDHFSDEDRLGGASANFAFHVHQLGGTARLVSRVGRDWDGNKLLASLVSQNIETKYVQMDDRHPTGRVDVTLTDGQPSYDINSPAAWDFLELTADLKSLAGNAAAVCFSTLAQRNAVSRRCIMRFLTLCPAATLRLFDVNLRKDFFSRDIIEFGLRHADILKWNSEEQTTLCRLFGWSPHEAAGRLFADYGVRIVVLTRGSEGCELLTPAERIVIPPVPVKLVDAVGAGDAFSAALTMALLKGKPLAEAGIEANRVGAFVAGQAGATPNLTLDLVSS